MDKLMEKLVVAKAIMDKAEGITRGSATESLPNINIQQFDTPNAKYNIPQEFLQENQTVRTNTKPVGVSSVDAIKNSKLPDEIKRLMIEHPIAQPQNQQTTSLSDELVEKASRLMKNQTNNYIPESASPTKQTSSSSSQIDYNLIQKMIEDSVRKVLKENGMISESTEKSNEVFSFRVGKHLFEGKVTKVKKLS
jgi:hypothetical protein